MKIDTELEQTLDRKMKSIHMNLAAKNGIQSISKTTVSFIQENEMPPPKGGDESYKRRSGYPIWSTFQPHIDFEQAMRGLLTYALEALEMDLSGSKIDYTVCGLDISGDLFMNQARVTMTIAKRVNRSEKIVKFAKTPEITLSDGSKYPQWKDLQKAVEKVIAEAWEYLKGKHRDDHTPLTFQLDMFDGDETELIEPVIEKKEKKDRKPKVQPPEPGVPGMMSVMGQA
jgi:hypothetical protein